MPKTRLEKIEKMLDEYFICQSNKGMDEDNGKLVSKNMISTILSIINKYDSINQIYKYKISVIHSDNNLIKYNRKETIMGEFLTEILELTKRIYNSL